MTACDLPMSGEMLAQILQSPRRRVFEFGFGVRVRVLSGDCVVNRLNSILVPFRAILPGLKVRRCGGGNRLMRGAGA